MKHGDKAKSKAASKASGKKSGKSSSKTSKVAQVAKGKATQTGSNQRETSSASGNGKTRGRPTPNAITFTNPVVAAAFKRAVRKYPNAFRRLSD